MGAAPPYSVPHTVGACKPFFTSHALWGPGICMASKSGLGKWWKYNYHFLAWFCLLAGLASLSLGLLGIYYDDLVAPDGVEYLSDIGAWSYWALLFGVMAAILGGYYTYSHIDKMRKFEAMMENRGRVNFMRDLDEIERLAYELGAAFEARVIERKREFKLK